MKDVHVGSVTFSNDKNFVLIAGPCVIENESHAFKMADSLKKLTDQLNIPFIYKSSFDKANRTSYQGQRGVGMDKGLKILEKIKDHFGCPVITDVHDKDQCAPVSNVCDILQIPAFLCRQTDLLEAAAKTRKALHVKKGQFLAPWDMAQVVKKIESFGSHKILLCDRGTSFGYNTLISDMRGIPIMQSTGYPVIFDATHSVQQPGGQGETSGGDRFFAPILARAAVAVGVAGVFIETHDHPDQAPSDGPNMIHLSHMESVLKELLEFDHIAKKYPRFL
jgi:2-dehydro-3-deoxyphosphooctonate aldolase (KDO 8-P synthase)